MRLLTRYILKEIFLPFVFSLLVIVFILFVNFLLRVIDRFLGRGLDLLTILEYLFLNLAWIVALATPMAVLIATLMTFGRMSEDNEITAMRSSGISFLTIIQPALLFGLIVSIGLVYFNNFILPEMNFRARILSGDIYRKRPGMNIEPGHFIDDLPDYGMIIQGKKDSLMENIYITSKNNQETKVDIISDGGTLTTIADALILTLYNGEIQELDNKDFRTLRRIRFKKHVIVLPADNLVLTRRDTSNRNDREMTVPMMRTKIKSYDKRINDVRKRLANYFKRATGDSLFPRDYEQAMQWINQARAELERDTTIASPRRYVKARRLKTLERQARNEFNLINSYIKSKNKYGVEIHKKFSLPFACILFVLVGAPLGVLARKGGFVVGISLSFGFFLVYYILMISGEEMADRNIVSPMVGMWTPNLLLLIVASYLTLHTVRERAPWRIKFPAFLKRKKKAPTEL